MEMKDIRIFLIIRFVLIRICNSATTKSLYEFFETKEDKPKDFDPRIIVKDKISVSNHSSESNQTQNTIDSEIAVDYRPINRRLTGILQCLKVPEFNFITAIDPTAWTDDNSDNKVSRHQRLVEANSQIVLK